jgi:hypothetical protein
VPEQGPGGPQLQQLQAQPGHAPCQARARIIINKITLKSFFKSAHVRY